MANPPLQPGRDHAISAASAAEMTRRHRNQATVSGARKPEEGALGGMFSKKAILALLSRPDAEYLRYYHARDAQGQRTLVLVASDANGNDLLDGPTTALDQHYPCPPFCPTEASALRG
jgi:hypothetical protein